MPNGRVSPLAPVLTAVSVAFFGVATGWAAVSSTLPGAPEAVVVVADVAAGWSFAFVGALLWVRYPVSRVGVLALAVGLALFLPDIRWFGTSLTWTLGSLLTDIHLVVLAWLILAFPTGRLMRGERTYVTVAMSYFAVLGILGHLFEEPLPGCAECPASFLMVRRDPDLNDLIWGIGQVVNLILVGVLVAMIIRKWRSASPAARRGLAPVVWALGPIGAVLIAAFLEPLIGFGEAGSLAVLIAERLTLIAFPAALVLGMVKTRLDQARVADLARVVEEAVDPEVLQRLIGGALGDPSARLGFWSDDAATLIDSTGHPIEVAPDVAEARIHSSDGTRLGSILHDAAVDPLLVEAVGATATLALRNERLRAELRRQLAEVEKSRERIAEAADNERRRIERDLHDGAQQGLLALGAALGSIRSKSEGEIAADLDEVIADLRDIIAELREFARGVHPPILTERGLGAAIEALAERAATPVTVNVTKVRCRPSAEAAVYFLVSEAIANATRHAEPSVIDIEVSVDRGMLRVLVTDDGRGGAMQVPGGGLQGLSDRFVALGGRLEVTGRSAGGTTVAGSVPCG